jgi:hypothetical protein
VLACQPDCSLSAAIYIYSRFTDKNEKTFFFTMMFEQRRTVSAIPKVVGRVVFIAAETSQLRTLRAPGTLWML